MSGQEGGIMVTTLKERLPGEPKRPQDEALRMHSFYRGKIEIIPKCVIRGLEDLAIWYTPGVAKPCTAIKENQDAVYEYTNKCNTVAIVTDGTRVLGLGDIGPEAGLPVMEGKALLFKYLGGVDAVPICLNTKNPQEVIAAVKWLKPSFGAVNLEDISQPKCFAILDTLRRELDIPVWHDDQQGTATVALAGLISSLKIVNKRIGEIKLALIGCGAAGMATARLAFASGLKPENTIVVDSKGILHRERMDIEERKLEYADKWRLCLTTNPEGRKGGIAEAMTGADVCISFSKPGPGVIDGECVRAMQSDAIVFACANPTPEIWPWEAHNAGAMIVATGRSDFPNQLNNALVFPGLFRGVLDVRAKTITDEMCLAAAKEIADYAEHQGLSEDHIVPAMDDFLVTANVAAAVGIKAQEQGIARIHSSRNELFRQAAGVIRRSRAAMAILVERGVISQPDVETSSEVIAAA
jgi:malate dehydrogenase (oxaloacetate-decarboxylating)